MQESGVQSPAKERIFFPFTFVLVCKKNPNRSIFYTTIPIFSLQIVILHDLSIILRYETLM